MKCIRHRLTHSTAFATDGKEVKKETKLGLSCKKEEDFPNWYSELVVSSELISYYDVSGCYILRPWAFSMWEVVQRWFDDNIKKLGVQNAYFPMFITEDVLNTEKDHVEGFAPEVRYIPHCFMLVCHLFCCLLQ